MRAISNALSSSVSAALSASRIVAQWLCRTLYGAAVAPRNVVLVPLDPPQRTWYVLPVWPFVKVYTKSYAVETMCDDSTVRFAELCHRDFSRLSWNVTLLVAQQRENWRGQRMSEIFPQILAAYDLTHVDSRDLLLRVMLSDFSVQEFGERDQIVGLETQPQTAAQH
jgi:hypothetical protein